MSRDSEVREAIEALRPIYWAAGHDTIERSEVLRILDAHSSEAAPTPHYEATDPYPSGKCSVCEKPWPCPASEAAPVVGLPEDAPNE